MNETRGNLTALHSTLHQRHRSSCYWLASGLSMCCHVLEEAWLWRVICREGVILCFCSRYFTETNVCLLCTCFTCLTLIALYQWLWNKKTQLIFQKMCSCIVRRFMYNKWFLALLQENALWLQYWATAIEQLCAITLKMKYDRAIKLAVKVTKACTIHFNRHNQVWK